MRELTLRQKKINLGLFQFFRGFVVAAGIVWLAITLISGSGLALIYGIIGFIVCCIIFSSSEQDLVGLRKNVRP